MFFASFVPCFHGASTSGTAIKMCEGVIAKLLNGTPAVEVNHVVCARYAEGLKSMKEVALTLEFFQVGLEKGPMDEPLLLCDQESSKASRRMEARPVMVVGSYVSTSCAAIASGLGRVAANRPAGLVLRALCGGVD